MRVPVTITPSQIVRILDILRRDLLKHALEIRDETRLVLNCGHCAGCARCKYRDDAVSKSWFRNRTRDVRCYVNNIRIPTCCELYVTGCDSHKRISPPQNQPVSCLPHWLWRRRWEVKSRSWSRRLRPCIVWWKWAPSQLMSQSRRLFCSLQR